MRVDNRIAFEMLQADQRQRYTYDAADEGFVAGGRPVLAETFRYNQDGFDSASFITTTCASGFDCFTDGYQVLGLQKDSDFFYFITDGLSSVRLVVDEDGDVVASYDADEFGNSILVDENGASTDQRWVGGLGYRDEVAATGLYYLRQRYYDAKLGRWLSRDPIGILGGLNLYSYVTADPVNFVDPSGLWTSILIQGTSSGKTYTDPAGVEHAVYQAIVYKDGKKLGSFLVTRDAPYNQSECGIGRYGTYSEAPPGSYYVVPETVAGRLGLSDVWSPSGYDARIVGSLAGEQFDRTVIQIHPAGSSLGCITSIDTSWSENKNEDFWKIRNAIIGDVNQGLARVFVQPRHLDSRDQRTMLGKVNRNFLSSPGVVGPSQFRNFYPTRPR